MQTITQSLLLILAVMIVMSSSSFWSLWLSLEIFSFLLIPWLIEGSSKISKTHIFLYFLIQFMASMMFLVCSLGFMNKIYLITLFSSILMKISSFPFHSWFIYVIPHLTWEKILILTSLSKLAPLSMMNLVNPPEGFIWIIMLGLIVSFGGFNTTCLRSIVAYSSVAHSSWMILSVYLSKSISMLYISVYLMISMPLTIYFMLESMTNMKSALMVKKSKSHLMIIIMTLSGIPPFLGFIPKFVVIQHMVTCGALVEASFLGLLSIIPVYFYFKTGALSLGMKAYLEFIFSSSMSIFWVILVSVSILAIVSLLLGFSLYMKY